MKDLYSLKDMAYAELPRMAQIKYRLDPCLTNESRLMEAANHNIVEVLRWYIEQKTFTANSTIGNGWHSLLWHTLYFRGCIKSALYLLSTEFDVNQSDAAGSGGEHCYPTFISLAIKNICTDVCLTQSRLDNDITIFKRLFSLGAAITADTIESIIEREFKECSASGRHDDKKPQVRAILAEAKAEVERGAFTYNPGKLPDAVSPTNVILSEDEMTKLDKFKTDVITGRFSVKSGLIGFGYTGMSSKAAIISEPNVLKYKP